MALKTNHIMLTEIALLLLTVHDLSYFDIRYFDFDLQDRTVTLELTFKTLYVSRLTS